MHLAAFVPGAPVLVPDLAPGSGLDVVAACAPALSAVAMAVRGGALPLVLVGPGRRTLTHSPRAWGTLAGFGVGVEAPAAHEDDMPALPASLTVGRWLLDRAGAAAPTLVQEVADDEPPAGCRALGECLAVEAGPDAVWVVVGEGSACRTEKAPGHLDDRAAAFDAAVAAALARGDLAALAALPLDTAADLLVSGRAPWQVLAAAAAHDDGAPSRSELLLDDAPLGVGYLAALWCF